jgi:hypothetical protein
MVHEAKELSAKLDNLTLAGQNEAGELEWVGSRNEWNRAEFQEIGDSYCPDCQKVSCSCDHDRRDYEERESNFTQL